MTLIRILDTQIGERDMQIPSPTAGGIIQALGISSLALSSDPGINQDSTQGYQVGSVVFNNTAGQLRMWTCRDASTGAAKWTFDGADYANGGTNPPGEITQFGSSNAAFAEEGNIYRYVPGVAGMVTPGGIGNDYVVATYTVPANAFDGLAGTNRGIMVVANGNYAANANTKRVRLWWNPATAVVGSVIGAGGSLMADTLAQTTNGGSWQVSGNVFKRGSAGSNTQTVTSNGAISGSLHAGMSTTVDATATESGSILIAITINNTTTATDAGLCWMEVNCMN